MIVEYMRLPQCALDSLSLFELKQRVIERSRLAPFLDLLIALGHRAFGRGNGS